MATEGGSVAIKREVFCRFQGFCSKEGFDGGIALFRWGSEPRVTLLHDTSLRLLIFNRHRRILRLGTAV